MRILTTKPEIQNALQEFSDHLSGDLGVKPKKNKYGDNFKQIHSPYWITVNIDGDWNGLTLYGPPFKNTTRLLELTVNTPNTGATRSAARLVEIDGQIELLHDGRVSKRDNRPKPSFNNAIELDGHHFYRLGPLSGSMLFESLIIFHENRFFASGNTSPEKVYCGDYGATNGYERSAAVICARHSPLCKAFVEQIRFFTPKSVQSALRPDIFFSAAGRSYLVEAKPDSGFHSIITAIGQLIVYSKAFEPDVRVLLSPAISDRIMENKVIRNVLSDHGIAHVTYELVEGKYIFFGLEHIGLNKELS